MSALYFVITSTEDGIRISEPMSGDVLEERLADNYWGDATFLPKVPQQDSGHFWNVPEGSMLIIRGEVAVPKPVTVVKAFRVPR